MSILGAFIVPHPPIIIPEIGQGEEKKISLTAESYRKVMKEISDLKPDTIIITSPHSLCYYDYFHISPGHQANGNLGQFNAGQISFKVNYDADFVSVLSSFCQEEKIPAGTLGDKKPELDHGTMIPLYFLKEFIPLPNIVRIGLSCLPNIENYKLGLAIQKTAQALDKRTVIIASGDLSHVLKEDGPYGFKKEGPEFDEQIVQDMKNADFLSFFSFDPSFLEKAEECGLGSFQIMAGALDGYKVRPEFLSYQGPFGVGYGCCSFFLEGRDESRSFLKILQDRIDAKTQTRNQKQDPYVALARSAVEMFINEGQALTMPSDLPADMKQNKAGVFVSIHINGHLRGCIGTFSPCCPSIGEEIIHNAISACSEDPRFPKVETYELSELEYSVDVLSGLTRVTDNSELDPKKYGIVVQKGYKRGLLLPNLDGVDTVEEQIKIAKQKAEIPQEDYVSIYRFTTVRHL